MGTLPWERLFGLVSNLHRVEQASRSCSHQYLLLQLALELARNSRQHLGPAEPAPKPLEHLRRPKYVRAHLFFGELLWLPHAGALDMVTRALLCGRDDGGVRRLWGPLRRTSPPGASLLWRPSHIPERRVAMPPGPAAGHAPPPRAPTHRRARSRAPPLLQGLGARARGSDIVAALRRVWARRRGGRARGAAHVLAFPPRLLWLAYRLRQRNNNVRTKHRTGRTVEEPRRV